jgi:hypothetical protein
MGDPPTRRRRVGHSGPGSDFREPMATSFQTPIVSIPYHSTLCHFRDGYPQGRQPSAILLPSWIPHAVHYLLLSYFCIIAPRTCELDQGDFFRPGGSDLTRMTRSSICPCAKMSIAIDPPPEFSSPSKSPTNAKFTLSSSESMGSLSLSVRRG